MALASVEPNGGPGEQEIIIHGNVQSFRVITKMYYYVLWIFEKALNDDNVMGKRSRFAGWR